MNDSDFSIIGQLVQSLTGSEDGTTTIDIAINDLSVDAVMAYNTVDAVEVPADAIAAVESGEASSMQEIVDAAM